MAGLDFVSDLKPFKSMWKVRVKVVRLWKQYSGETGETIEMVLVDSKGDMIHATVKKEQVSQFDHILRQGVSKLIVNFSLTHSVGSYRTTGHPYRLVFLSTTRVLICEHLPRVVTGFKPVPFTSIMDGSLDPDYLVDVIGQIVEVTHLDVVFVNGKDTPKLALEIRNQDDERLPMVLWGKFATAVDAAIQLRGVQQVICVVRFGKIKIWKDERSLQNAFNISDVALNADMVEVENFRALLPKDELTLAIVDNNPLEPVNGVSEKDDFFIHTPRKTIDEVLAARQIQQCIVMCTIGAIDIDMGWYYLTCKLCSKKVLTVPTDPIDDGINGIVFRHKYFCVECNSYSPKLLPRYKLHIVVIDNTSNTKFLLFDNLVLQLLHKPCIELTGPITNEIQGPEEIPVAIKDLVGKTYLFKILIERGNYLYKQPTFKVLKIITNPQMITAFDFSASPTGSEESFVPLLSIQSDAPEGSMMAHGSCSNPSVSKALTPAKRIRAPVINLEAAFEQNAAPCISRPVKIKKEKVDESG